MTPEQKGSLPLRLEKLFYELQGRIFSDVVRRIKAAGEITSTADYQINKLLILGNSTEFIEQEIKRLTRLTDPEIWELYDKVVNWEYVRYKDIYQQINGNFIPLEENKLIQQWAYAVMNQTKGEIQNITQSMGFSLKYGKKTVFTPFSEYYQKYLDRACMDIVTGAFDYNTVLRRVVKELTASGIKTVDYASGYSSRVPVAVRRAVMTGVSQLSAKINEKVAKDLGTDTYEVTWHAGHRPDHWWGGNIYTRKELEVVCGLGNVDGLCGANCRHSYNAFVKGYSVPTYTREQLQELERKEQLTKSYQGKEYTPYQASQMQRKLETKMRSQRAYVKQLQQGKASSDDVVAAKSRYLNTLHQYQGFSKKMRLPEQMERVYMDGLGRIAPGKKTYTKTIAKFERDAILKSKLQEAGLRGKIHATPTEIDMNLVTFDDEHINEQRRHNVSVEEAMSFIREAIVSETVWNGRFERYYSLKGVAYVNRNNLKIRTTFKGDEIKGATKKAIEVLKKYG